MEPLGPLDAWDIWGDRPPRTRHDLPIPGSPERCVLRWVAEGADGRLWLVERLAPGQAARREGVGRLLEGLARQGLDWVRPYVRTAPTGGNGGTGATAGQEGGRLVAEDGHGCWQVSPFVPGQEPRRPDYVFDPLAGRELARVLIGLGAAWEAMRPGRGPEGPPGAGLAELSVAGYVRHILDRMARDPGLGGEAYPRAAAAAGRIAPFLDAEPDLPRTLAHGDLHPLNCIWRDFPGNRDCPDGRAFRIVAVIDWEFAGLRHGLYDLANAVGCMGIEDPACLGRDGAPATMVAALRAAGRLDGRDMPLLRPAVAASRFGWLSEWLRRGDREMLGLELDYLDLLTGAA